VGALARSVGRRCADGGAAVTTLSTTPLRRGSAGVPATRDRSAAAAESRRRVSL